MFSAISVFKVTSSFLLVSNASCTRFPVISPLVSSPVSSPSLCRTNFSDFPTSFPLTDPYSPLPMICSCLLISPYLSFRYQFHPILGHDSAFIPVITLILHGCFTVDIFTRRTEVAKWPLLYLLLSYARITIVWYSGNNGLDILSCSLWESGHEWLPEKWIHFCYSTWKP